MEKRWSKEQEQAIYFDLISNLLLSAGAGSGKTAVLTERIYQLIKKGASLDEFLVLTFTNLAASEMKSRTSKKLLADPSLSKLAALVDAAHIETFDSFCLYVVKRFHYYLNLPKEVNIIDESILDINKRLILREIFDYKYENHIKEFEELITTFSIRNDDSIFEMVLKIFKQAELSINKEYFFKNYVIDTYNEQFVDDLLLNYFNEAMNAFKEAREVAENLSNADDADKYLVILDDLLTARDYDSLRIKLQKIENLSARGKASEDKKERVLITQTIKKYMENAQKEDFGDSKTIKELHLSNKKYASLLLDITKELDERILEYKKSQNCYSFSDIANFALKIISETPARDILRKTFKYIMVDEYQDTSDIQEAVINEIGDNNIFMVGDVKQSIYRFRNANCKIFQDKFNNYKKGIGGVEIDLNRSYRSRRQIVDGINEMFSKLMPSNFGEIDYNNGHHFEFGQKLYDDVKADNQDYSIELYGYSLEDNEKIDIKEAELIADDIIKKCNSKYKVFKDGKLKDVEFSDFALIASRNANFDTIRRVFGQRNIPLNVIQDKDIGENDTVIVSKNLIKFFFLCLKEDYESEEFIKTYVSLARSFLFQIKDQEIYTRIKEKKILLTPFVLEIERVKEKIRYLSIKEVLNYLYNLFNIDEKISELGRYKENLIYCEMILSIANNFDSTGGSLEDFINYFDNISDFKLLIKASDKSSVENAVTLLNIHKSKGLEFPICYFYDLEAKMNMDNTKGAFHASKKYGLLLPITTAKNTSFMIAMFKRDERLEMLLEQIRLYYVALTRAKEKIIILNKIDEKTKEDKEKTLKQCTSFKDFNRYLNITDDVREVVDEKTSLVLKQENIVTHTYDIKHVDIPSKLIEKKRASKTISDDAILDVIEFGNHMHKLLEIVNFDTKDTTFIKDEKERKYIDKILNLSIFKGVSNDNILHEYNFYDDINDVHGVIDLLVNKDNEILIIDFKLKNISDEEYVKQLQTYKAYISTITKKPVKTYLLSIIDGVIMEVE